MKKLTFFMVLVVVFNVSVYSQWVPVGPYGGNLTNISSLGQNVITSVSGFGFFTSSNSGYNWVFRNNDPPPLGILTFVYYSNILYAGTTHGIYQSTNFGNNWIQNSLSDKQVTSLLVNSNYIYAGTHDSGVYVSTNNGLNWIQKNSGLSNKQVKALAFCGSYIFAGTEGGVFVSNDNGNNWALKSWGFCSSPMPITSLAVIGTYVFACYYDGCGVYRSTNYGDNWYQINTGLPTSVYVSTIASNGNNLYAGTTYNAGYYSTGLYISTNNGSYWSNLDNNQISGIISGITFSGQNMYVCTGSEYSYPYNNGGVFCTTNNGTNWSSIYDGIYNLSLTPIVNIGTYLFTGSTYMGYGGYYQGMFVSSNLGSSWNKINSPTVKRYINALSSYGNNLYMGTEDSGIFVSTNYGQNWTNVEHYNYLSVVSVLGVSGSKIFAGSYLHELYISTNNGINWNKLDTSLHVNWARDIVVSSSDIYVGFDYGGVIRSTNNGLNWIKINNGLPGGSCMALAKDGQNLYTCYYWGGGIYRSSNNGNNWIQISNSITNRNFSTIVAYNDKIFVGADSVIYFSSNFGTNWTKINQGFPLYNILQVPLINKLYIINGYIYATTNYRSVWRRPLSDFLIVNKISSEIPDKYSLYQNYPNPFNPTTNIKWSMPQNGNVKLIIYNLLGKEIESPVNEKLNAGMYEFVWDASKFSSGIYLYRVITDNFVDTKKMVLLK